MRSVSVVLSLLIIAAHSGQSSTPQSSDGPTLEETANWLSSNLVGVQYKYQFVSDRIDPKKHTAIEKDRTVSQTDSKVVQAHLDHCRLSIVEKENRESSLATDFTTRSYMVPLDRIRTVVYSIYDRSKEPDIEGRVFKYDPGTVTKVEMTSDQEVIHVSTRESSTLKGYRTTDTESDEFERNAYQLFSDDSAIALRISNALKRAVILCNASSKPNLF